MALGDRLFNWCAIAGIAAWFLGFLLSLAAIAIEKCGAGTQEKTKPFFDAASRALSWVMKYAFGAALVLILIRFVASFLGWGPPLPDAEPGERYDPRF